MPNLNLPKLRAQIIPNYNEYLKKKDLCTCTNEEQLQQWDISKQFQSRKVIQRCASLNMRFAM